MHQVATIPNLSTVPSTIFRRIRSKLTKVVNGLKVHLLPKFKSIPNPIPISIPEGTKSDCITKEVHDLLLDDVTEQELPNRYSKRVFNITCLRFEKVKHLHQQPIIQDGRNRKSTIYHQTCLLRYKTQYQESLPPHVSRPKIQRLIVWWSDTGPISSVLTGYETRWITNHPPKEPRVTTATEEESV
ncbi:hypothetical protein ACTFIW_003327 [Dictyostelium discoideum]